MVPGENLRNDICSFRLGTHCNLDGQTLAGSLHGPAGHGHLGHPRTKMGLPIALHNTVISKQSSLLRGPTFYLDLVLEAAMESQSVPNQLPRALTNRQQGSPDASGPDAISNGDLRLQRSSGQLRNGLISKRTSEWNPPTCLGSQVAKGHAGSTQSELLEWHQQTLLATYMDTFQFRF